MFDWLDTTMIVTIMTGWLALLGAAQVIVRLTPTEKDDRIISMLGNWTEKVRNLLSLGAPNAVTRDQNR